jgi:hypothetical protein
MCRGYSNTAQNTSGISEPMVLLVCPKQTAESGAEVPVNHCATSIRWVPWSVMGPPA